MIEKLVDFALKNRFLVLAVVLMLFVWGGISFHNLPVDAYPDVADNYVNIITQWPGHSAEDIEKQITVPCEIAMAGIPDMKNLRSFSLAGISSIMMNFNDSSDNSWNRERVLERLTGVTLPANLVPQLQTDWSPAGQIYWYTIESKNPNVDVMEQKSLEDWVLQKQFKNVPGVVDVASFGGITKEYQIRLNPDKLIGYGLSIAQVEQQLTINNANAGGSFIVDGTQQINVQAQGLYENVQQIEDTVVKTQAGAPIRIKDIAEVEQGPKIRLGQISKTTKDAHGTLIDNPDVVEGSVLLRKGADADPVLKAIEQKVKEINDHILPRGVRVVPFMDRSDLVHLTTHTVLHNLSEGIVLVLSQSQVKPHIFA
jgi:cobalt-zinc-cadmium resistance protein CzcA